MILFGMHFGWVLCLVLCLLFSCNVWLENLYIGSSLLEGLLLWPLVLYSWCKFYLYLECLMVLFSSRFLEGSSLLFWEFSLSPLLSRAILEEKYLFVEDFSKLLLKSSVKTIGFCCLFFYGSSYNAASLLLSPSKCSAPGQLAHFTLNLQAPS